LNIFQSEPFFIEVVPLHIDKAKSLDYLLTTLKLTKEQLIACGDGGNDVTMIDYAGLGVAMKNACEEVKEVADYETDSCDQDGVAKVIEKFFK
jgi:hydroxymethylpyrimidine pyrophosphatase-like HAD family hydrolase